ncbi:excalibur calcium-binding domain-containing protein [Spirilliplanes yamanashiensis]|uniref:Excalibur calcium-binding domain-containing protein n=1 Tax=Spirilliplanes yamanashiensis TaxID=42233 RepID=A0A8J3Y821_9ACTN|nr:DUF1524 domain-containing protein [Spirilliplanes yamanashiensis]MDP9817219.1 hypothetical protein [Spirilliplanes yamanashiensis]GIJ03127.1 hypothetical protein Sya03_24790 [Spirilliplanes yamanashiensis]
MSGRLLAVAALLALSGGCTTGGSPSPVLPEPSPPHSSPPPSMSADVAAQLVAVRSMLAHVPSGGRGARTGYDREAMFGPAWQDVDGNGCDTRDDVLRRDLTGVESRGCEVTAGVLDDPYTGRHIDFATDPAAIQVDHVVPLALAWQLGADRWVQEDRVRFANDPANLLAVDASANQQKRDSGPDSWLPPDRSYRCTYAIRFTRVLSGYRLRLTPSMRDAIGAQLLRCSAIRGSPATLTLLPASPPSAAAELPPGEFFATCAEVRAAGRAPLRRGEPGYRAELDRDGDGHACDASR